MRLPGRSRTSFLAAVLSMVLVAAACASDGEPSTETATDDESSTTAAPATDDTTDESTDATEDSSDDDAMVATGDLVVSAVSFADSTVTITNNGTEPVDLTGYSMCNRPNYRDAPAETIEPGATLDLDASDLDLRASAGEFGLYSSSSFDSAEAMVAYVQWGNADNGRAAVAVEAGLIEEGEFVDNGGEDIANP